MKRPASILASADDGYAMQLAVMLRSVGESAVEGPVEAHVIHDAIPAGTRDRVVRSVADLPVRIVWNEVDLAALPPTLHMEGYNGVPATYFRLLLDRFLPEQVGRVIYLDLDLLVRSDLRELAARPLHTTVAAVRIKPSLGAMLGFAPREAPDAAARPAFNAGVLVIDRQRWSQRDVGRRALELAARYGSRFRHVDQDALNLALVGDWTELPPQWNVRPDPFGFPSWRRDSARAPDPSVIHFAGPRKPWDPVSDHAETGMYFELVDRTDWTGWRPRSLTVAQRVWELCAERGHRRVDRLREICVKAAREGEPHGQHKRLLMGEYLKRPWMLATYPASRRGQEPY